MPTYKPGQRSKECPTCKGDGYGPSAGPVSEMPPYSEPDPCPTCGGTGRVPVTFAVKTSTPYVEVGLRGRND